VIELRFTLRVRAGVTKMSLLDNDCRRSQLCLGTSPCSRALSDHPHL